MTRSTRDAQDRGWVWLLRAVGLLFAMALLSNVANVLGTLGDTVIDSQDSSVTPNGTVDDSDVESVPGVYHVACVEFRPTLTARFRSVVRRMLPARLIASAAELPPCRRCSERIEPGSQIWIAGDPGTRGR